LKTILVAIASVCLSVLALGQRLPQTATPSHYTLKLTPDLESAKFTGEEVIAVRVLKPTNSITLNALDLTFETVSIAAAGKTLSAKVTTDDGREMATLTVADTLPAGPAEIKIRYAGTLNEKLRGFYLAESAGRRYAVTQFEPTDARRAFPGFDEPAYKAVFDISVVAPAEDTAISNGRIVADEPGPGPKQHTLRFAQSPIMSTYLVAVLVGQFECISGGVDEVPIRVCAPPGQQSMGRFALATAENTLQFYNRYFSIKYPYGKLDLIAIPDFEAGAMENVAAITFRDIALLVDEKQASVPMLKEVATVIAHEMAHQWFGNLVTMQWWDDIWLNEGFATWMETKPVAAWKPEWHLELDEQESANEAMVSDSLENTRPVHQAAETSAEINALFDAIAYNKAAAVLRMLEGYVGPQVFRQGVNAYIEAHANANATAPDFWNTITSTSNKPADRILSAFVTIPGVPVVAAEFQCSGKVPTVTLRQQRFFLNPQRSGAGNQTWVIPVCLNMLSAGGPTAGSSTSAGAAAGGASVPQCELLGGREQTFKLDRCGLNAFLNAGGAGYYRSAYPAEAITALSSKMDKLTAVERLALLNNEWALVRSGSHRIGSFMDVAWGLRSDQSATIIRNLGQQLTFITDYLVTGADRDEYQQWVRRLLRPAIQELGWTAKPGDSDERRQLRATVFYILGYNGRDPEVLEQANKFLQEYLRDPATVDPTLLHPVLRLAAMQGTPALYDELRRRAAASSDPETYYRYLEALANFSDPELLQRTLEYALSNDVRSQDMAHLVAAVMANPAGRELAWQFVRSHWDQVQQKGSVYSGIYLVQAMSSFCDPTMAQQVQQFFQEHPLPVVERNVRQSLEQIHDCVETRQRQQPDLAHWLEQGQHTAVGQ
jgi:aminopeptidase N